MKKICDAPDNCTFSDCPTAFCDKDKPMTTSTPETDALQKELNDFTYRERLIGELACKLERERDEARDANRRANELIGNQAQENDKINGALIAELTQLRKVCDELAKKLVETRSYGLRNPPNSWYIERDKLLLKHSTLPHVIKSKGKYTGTNDFDVTMDNHKAKGNKQ